MTIKILAVDADDSTAAADITEGVQVLYDNVLMSMDWQSGFLDHEEQVRIVELGIACGFPDAEKHLAAIQETKLAEEKRQEEQVRRRAEQREAAERMRASWQDNHAALVAVKGYPNNFAFRP